MVHVSAEEEVDLENVADGMSEIHLGRKEKKRLMKEGRLSAKEEKKLRKKARKQ